MSESVAQLSQDRLSVLEQALPLAQDLAESFIDLNEWLTGLEIELENCPAVIPGHHPEGLMKQQVHNNVRLFLYPMTQLKIFVFTGAVARRSDAETVD
jgi:hypothetical protein